MDLKHTLEKQIEKQLTADPDSYAYEEDSMEDNESRNRTAGRTGGHCW
jgi:hypothetical protein